ncbi:MAG: hypothetical protein KF864_03335 [Phycisphaeraceae bacterium]|nr:hypothetical protein [Phycisphaeraceae bacterium]
MDKMFYTLEEAAAKLSKTASQVRQMASSGQIQEFRDGDRYMYKCEQIDLIAGGDEIDIIPLADANDDMIPLSASGTGMSVRDDRESTGISIFEAEGTDESDPSAVTRVTASPVPLMDPGDDAKSASGSGGLLDLTREGDDTSLGANLLDDVYGSETVAQQTAVDSPSADGGDLFESPAADMSEAAGAAAVPMLLAAEPYDGAGSGLVGGLAIGMIAAAGIAAFAIIMAMTSTLGSGSLAFFADNFWALVGAAAGVTLIAAILGWVLGRRS